ncbi:hypothetical protein pb186bvf_011276 [Paramecium bursaria]
MSEEPLRDTFDGYLMFDFNKIQGLMAQTFEQDEDDYEIPKIQKAPKRKAYDVPGPYLDSPPLELERGGDIHEGILFNEQLNEDDVHEIIVEDDQMSNFNYSSSGFNLLEHIKIDFEDDAYDIQNDPSTQNLRKTSKSKKQTLYYTPSLQFDSNGDQKITMINIQNQEILRQGGKIDDFYKYLRDDLKLNMNSKINDDPIISEQLESLVSIRLRFEEMGQNIRPRNHAMTQKLDQFKYSLDHFINMVEYVVENGNKRSKMQRDQQVINSKKDQTTTMSVAFFKAMELLQCLRELLEIQDLLDKKEKKELKSPKPSSYEQYELKQINEFRWNRCFNILRYSKIEKLIPRSPSKSGFDRKGEVTKSQALSSGSSHNLLTYFDQEKIQQFHPIYYQVNQEDNLSSMEVIRDIILLRKKFAKRFLNKMLLIHRIKKDVYKKHYQFNFNENLEF